MVESNPLVLLVEDDPNSRSTKIDLLRLNGFAAIGVASKKEAEKELRACPSIDILVTDVNLDVDEQSDISGIDLARQVKESRPNLPIIGYSGRFQSTELPEEDLQPFKAVVLKGKGFNKHISEWREYAVEHRQLRENEASIKLEEFRTKHKIADYEFNLLREFVPGSTESSSSVPMSELSIEEVLSATGYHLKIIEKEDVPSEAASEGVNVESPIAVWLRSSEDGVVAEVYKFPELYASGETENDAISNVLILMAGYQKDLAESREQDLSPHLMEMRNYLNHVFK